MPNLTDMNCIACRGTEAPLSEPEMHQYMPQVPEWRVKEVDGEKRLERVFRFRNFVEALAFTDRVGAIAEQEDHHPMLVTEWGKVTVTWWTHKIHGLHQNDFIMAAKTDRLL